MSDPTRTRKDIRRSVAKELQMPFFRRFAAGEGTVDSSSSATKIKDAMLTQADGFWSGHWFYGLVAEDLSIIRSFASNDNTFMLEVPMAATPTAGDKYEIHSIWNALEIHNAINRAIHMSERVFPNSVVDTSLVLQEDKLTYSITSLATRPFSVHRVYIENVGNVETGVASAGGAASITLESVPSGINTNWKISIYAGTGTGQLKNYASNVGNVVTVNSVWTTAPDSTSKYAVWDATEEIYDWRPLYDWYPDAKEWPDEIRLRFRMTSFYGLRIKIEYLALHSDMATDAATISIPEEYLIPKVCSILHGMRLNDTKADRELHFAEMDRYEKMAESFLGRFAQHNPDTQILNPERGYRFNPEDPDPLDW